jgi:peptide/nickel transport system permease protein
VLLKYALYRLALAVPTLVLLSALTFFLGLLAPSDPVTIMLGQHANPAEVARLKHEYGLDRPALVQYGDYLWDALHGDFGVSYPATATLAGYAILYALLVGLPLGFLAAARQDTWVDRLAVGASVLGFSVPNFVLGPILVLIFAVQLHWVPVAFRGYPIDFILPAIALGNRPAGLIARMTRASMLEAIRQDYVRTGLAKGLTWRRVLVRHALRNALVPILTVVGISAGYLMGGSFVVETVFGIPGIGRLSIDSIKQFDYPVIQAVTLLGATAFVLINLGVDLLYGFIDPRIRTAAPAA